MEIMVFTYIFECANETQDTEKEFIRTKKG
jgi:hypothetical protein